MARTFSPAGWAPDTFVPGGGDDTINGGVEFQDIVDYSGEQGPINMDFDAESAVAQGTDSLLGIEKVIGTPYNDWFLMGQGSSSAWHSANGAGGNDTISFANSQTAISVNLPSGMAKRLGGPTDELSGIEAVVGSPFGDDLMGTDGRERFAAIGGRDELQGSGGDDVLNAGAGNDTVHGQADDDALRGGPGRDDLDGGSGRDACVGGRGEDHIIQCER
jgi:serralysin